MERVTESQLAAVVARINRMTNSPQSAYVQVNGEYQAQIGNFHLDHAYGGVSLFRMSNPSGGVSDVFQIGHVSKRELLGAMFAFIRGLETGQCD